MHAQAMIPQTMPLYVQSPWANRGDIVPSIPDSMKNRTAARVLWARLFDVEQKRWPSPREWDAFPELLDLIDQRAAVDRQIQQERDAATRDSLTDQLVEADRAVVDFARNNGFPQDFLANIAGNVVVRSPRPERQPGESIEAFEDRRSAWEQTKAFSA